MSPLLLHSLFIHALRLAACLWNSPTLATLSKRQEEWALAAVMLNTLLSPARMILLSWSIPCIPLDRPLALNWESAIVPSKLWRSHNQFNKRTIIAEWTLKIVTFALKKIHEEKNNKKIYENSLSKNLVILSMQEKPFSIIQAFTALMKWVFENWNPFL